jgi:hypothetical protein
MRAPVFLAIVSFLSSASLTASCAGPASTSAPAATELDVLTPVLSVKELMEHIVDPTAGWIFDAAVIDVSEKGVVETK